MDAVALEDLTTSELLDELEQRLRGAQTGVNGTGPEHTIHWNFSASGGATPPDILRIRMDLAGLTRASFSTAFGISPESVEEWLSGGAPIPAWVIPAIRVYEMLSASAREKLLRTRSARAGGRSRNTHPFACIEEL